MLLTTSFQGDCPQAVAAVTESQVLGNMQSLGKDSNWPLPRRITKGSQEMVPFVTVSPVSSLPRTFLNPHARGDRPLRSREDTAT